MNIWRAKWGGYAVTQPIFHNSCSSSIYFTFTSNGNGNVAFLMDLPIVSRIWSIERRYIQRPWTGTKSVKTARWRTVCAMSCHLSRISYEPVTHVHLKQIRRDKSWHLEKIFLNISKLSPRHGRHYFTWPASPRISTHTGANSSLTGA